MSAVVEGASYPRKEPLPFPALIDNTMRSSFLLCPKKFYWEFIENLTGSGPSIHLHAGGAFASGLEGARRAFYGEGKSVDESLKIGLEKIIVAYGDVIFPETKSGDKSLDNVIRAYDSYLQLQYPLGKDPAVPHRTANGEVMVEFSFSIPTGIKHPVTGDPILYGGRSDMIAEMFGALWVTDEKTTTSLGEQWAKNWTLDSQFTGYMAAAMMYGYPVAGALVRGVGLLKTKITHAEVQVKRGQWEIDRWWNELHYDIERMIKCWQDDRWPMALDKHACNSFGGCPFVMLDTSPAPEAWIPLHYRTRTWNPLAKDKGENLLSNPAFAEKLRSPDLNIADLNK